MSFYGRLVTIAYDYKFFVNIDGQEIAFEADGAFDLKRLHYRVAAKPIDIELVKHIGHQLEHLRPQQLVNVLPKAG